MYDFENDYLVKLKDVKKSNRMLTHLSVGKKLIEEDRPFLKEEIKSLDEKLRIFQILDNKVQKEYMNILDTIMDAAIFNRNNLLSVLCYLIWEKEKVLYEETTEIINRTMYTFLVPHNESVYESITNGNSVLITIDESKNTSILNEDLSSKINASSKNYIDEFIKYVINYSYLKKQKSTNINGRKFNELLHTYLDEQLDKKNISL